MAVEAEVLFIEALGGQSGHALHCSEAAAVRRRLRDPLPEPQDGWVVIAQGAWKGGAA